jgi:hypothetical protein
MLVIIIILSILLPIVYFWGYFSGKSDTSTGLFSLPYGLDKGLPVTKKRTNKRRGLKKKTKRNKPRKYQPKPKASDPSRMPWPKKSTAGTIKK